jgi:N,N-dimethylformamidase
MKQLTGYVMSDSEPAGGTFRIAADSQGREIRARLVGIDGPEQDFGMGLWASTRDLDGCPLVVFEGRDQVTTAGSFGYARAVPSPHGDDGLSCTLWFWPGQDEVHEPMTLLSLVAVDGSAGCTIATTSYGQVSFRAWDLEDEVTVVTDASVLGRTWNGIALSIDRPTDSIELVLAERTRVRGTRVLESRAVVGPVPAVLDVVVDLGLGGRPRQEGGPGADELFEGKVDNPRIWSQPLTESQLVDALHDRPVAATPVAEWAFGPAAGDDWDPNRVRNPHNPRLDLVLANRPQTGVTGHRWTGRSTDFRVAPAEYSAVRLHADDLADAGWEVNAEISIPGDLGSGLYGVELTCGDETDVIPVYVRPPAGGSPTAQVLYLVPTMTYQAYGNDRQHAHADFGDMTAQRDNGPYEDWIDAHPEFGSSLYDPHPDGSGCSYSTRRRPLGNVRPDYISWITGFPRHYSADLAIVSWLRHTGKAFEVATDHDLHRDGVDLLARYAVVVTGSHPEYYSGQMLDALSEHLQRGGRLMYLGGNGFYWVTGVAEDGSIEVRRGHAGTRSSESLPGEDTLTLTGEPGGLWRHRGRTPNELVGVGFAAQGWTGGVPYVVAEGLPDELHAVLFGDLPAGSVIGDFGSLRGAAGDEVDRFDLDRGSPPNTVVLATSSPFNDGYQPAVEDHPTLTPGVGGGSNPKVRADLTYIDLPDGGAVFSTGSINWFSCLPVNGFDNDIARVSTNVLNAFVTRDL